MKRSYLFVHFLVLLFFPEELGGEVADDNIFLFDGVVEFGLEMMDGGVGLLKGGGELL